MTTNPMVNTMSNLRDVVWRNDVDRAHLLHVGAHEGQEMSFYREAKVRDITLVEPSPEHATSLRMHYPDVKVIQAACSDEEGTLPFYVMHPTNVSTLMKPGPKDRVKRVIEVPVVTLKSLTDEMDIKPTILVVDAQGKELNVLRGADLEKVTLVVVETCTKKDDPNMASYYGDVVEYMASQGFAEEARWARPYTDVNNFARGISSPFPGEEIRDVVFKRPKE